MSKHERNVIVDYIKYFCALEVVWMHSVDVCDTLSGGWENLNYIVMKIATILPPVELFFVFSAFYLFSREISMSRLIKWEKKLFITYVIYSVLYFSQITEHFSGRSVFLNLLSIIRQFFFTGYGIMGWFVPALAWGAVIVYLLDKLNKQLGNHYLSRIIVFVMAILSIFGSTYYYVIPNNPMKLFIDLFEGIGILRGIVYVYIGYELTYVDFTKKVNKREVLRTVITWIIMSCLIFYSQDNGLGLNTRGMLFKYLYVFFIAVIIFKISSSCRLDDRKVTDAGRISVVMYFVHTFLISINDYIDNPVVQWCIVVILSTIIGKMLVLLYRKGISICKYLM